MIKPFPAVEYPSGQNLLAHKAPPFFWTWSAHMAVFVPVFLLCFGVLGAVLSLTMTALYPLDPEFAPRWTKLAYISFVSGAALGFIPALAAATIVYVHGLPLRDLWAEYRQEGWSTRQCRTMYRRARATGTGLSPARRSRALPS